MLNPIIVFSFYVSAFINCIFYFFTPWSTEKKKNYDNEELEFELALIRTVRLKI